MREILFRGKRVDNGEWVYGDLLQDRDLNSFAIEYFDYYTDENGRQRDYCQDEIIPETVGQYTGLTDKNGTKIFEGDIVTTDIARPYLIVEFRDGCFMFNCNDGDKDYYDIMLPILDEQQTVYKHGEVIGNIHDNKELLGVE